MKKYLINFIKRLAFIVLFILYIVGAAAYTMLGGLVVLVLSLVEMLIFMPIIWVFTGVNYMDKLYDYCCYKSRYNGFIVDFEFGYWRTASGALFSLIGHYVYDFVFDNIFDNLTCD